MTKTQRSTQNTAPQAPQRFRIEIVRDRDCQWYEYLIYDHGKLVAGAFVRGGPEVARTEGRAKIAKLQEKGYL